MRCGKIPKRGLLFTATETGAFVSFDDGAHWQSLQLNLPHSPLHDLVVKNDDLVVATHGRSFWILDDITPLRQVSPDSAKADALLYTPQKAWRLYYPDAVDMRPPVGENPPAGALIDYYLNGKPAGDVTIDILDGQGKLVRHLSSKTAKKAEQPPEWPDMIHPTDTLPASAGMNRFVWNLRYDDPVQIPGAFYVGLPPRGPIAAPGRYTVKLTLAGKTQSVPLEIALDPRAWRTAGLTEIALSTQVYHDQDALHRAVNDIQRRQSHDADLQKQGAQALAQGDAIAKSATRSGALMQVKIKARKESQLPDMLNEQLQFREPVRRRGHRSHRAGDHDHAGLHAQLLRSWRHDS
jgi:hypothetical protein